MAGKIGKSQRSKGTLTERLQKAKGPLICPKCLNPYRPAKTMENLFGIFNLGWFECKYCGYKGVPIKLVKEEKHGKA